MRYLGFCGACAIQKSENGATHLAYDETLSQRVRDLISIRSAPVERKMMGGIVFMVDGNMCCGVTGDCLMVRVGEAARESALARPFTRPMEFGGRSPKGFIYVEAEGCSTDAALHDWVQRGLEFVATLPKK